MPQPTAATTTFMLDRSVLAEAAEPDCGTLPDFGEHESESVRAAALFAVEKGAITGPDGIELELVALRRSADAVIIALRPAAGRDPVLANPDGPLTFERMLASWRIPLDRILPEDQSDFKGLCIALESVCEEANLLMPHYRALLAGEQASTNTAAAVNLLRSAEQEVALTDPVAARALTDALKRAGGSSQESSPSARCALREVPVDDVVAIRNLCDQPAIAVPPAVVAALTESGDQLWMTLPRAQAIAAAQWVFSAPDPDCVQLELRDEILNLSQGDAGTSLDSAGNQTKYRRAKKGEPLVAFPLDPADLKAQVAENELVSATQVTLTARP
jgi:hypothetical protein